MDRFNGPSLHRPLSPSDPTEIRLVKLYPGEFNAPVRCVLEHVSLESHPEFIALSYTWGDPNSTSPILLNGQEYPVTTNLKSFLQHIQTLLYHTVKRYRHKEYFDQSFLQFVLRACPDGPPQDTDSDKSHDDDVGPSEADRTDQAKHFPSQEQHENGPPGPESIGLYLWIDALSINQQDIAERNRQVYRMRDIYSSASCLFIWLGDYSHFSEPDVESAFDYLWKLAQRLDSEVSEVNLEERTDYFPECFARKETAFQKELEILLPEEVDDRVESLRTIARILMAPWFRRAWIIQEFVVSRGPVTAWCGFHHLPWRTICALGVFCCESLIRLYGGTRKRVLTLTGAADSALNLLLVKEWHQKSQEQEPRLQDQSDNSFATRWFELLRLTGSNFEATEPRDAIYALLGLLDSKELPLELRPDYGLPVSQVFRSCAIYLLRHSRAGLDFLLSASRGLPNAPTWVPNWTTFGQAWENNPNASATPSVSADGRRLVVNGVFLGVVKSVVMPHDVWHDSVLDGSILELIPQLGMELAQIEDRCRKQLITLQLELSAEEFRARWGRVWGMHEDDLHLYDILVGRKQPEREHQEKGLFGTGVSLVPLYLSMASETGIAILESGHLVINRRHEPILEDDLVFMIKGICKPCILRQNGSYYRFCGMCWGSSYDDNPTEDFYEQHRVDQLVLV